MFLAFEQSRQEYFGLFAFCLNWDESVGEIRFSSYPNSLANFLLKSNLLSHESPGKISDGNQRRNF